MGVFKHKVAFKHTGGASKHMAASKHRGGIPTYRWYPSIWWPLNLWGHMDTPLVWQSMVSLWCLFWMPLIHLDTAICLDAHIQTHRGKPNIWRTSKHTGGVQTYGDVQPYRGVSKDRGHPNIQGIQTYRECKHMGYVQTYRWASKHMKVSKHMGTSKHTGVANIWGYSNIRWHSNIQGVHPNIWQHLNIEVASQHTGGIQAYSGI